MESILNNIVVVFQNAFIVLWYWMNTYRWELVLLIALIVVVILEVNEAKVRFVNDDRKVV